MGFLRGPAEVFWKRVSLFPDPLFLSHHPRHGTLRAVVVLAPQALSAGTLCAEAGGKDTAGRGENPRDFCFCC